MIICHYFLSFLVICKTCVAYAEAHVDVIVGDVKSCLYIYVFSSNNKNLQTACLLRNVFDLVQILCPNEALVTSYKSVKLSKI